MNSSEGCSQLRKIPFNDHCKPMNFLFISNFTCHVRGSQAPQSPWLFYAHLSYLIEKQKVWPLPWRRSFSEWCWPNSLNDFFMERFFVLFTPYSVAVIVNLSRWFVLYNKYVHFQKHRFLSLLFQVKFIRRNPSVRPSQRVSKNCVYLFEYSSAQNLFFWKHTFWEERTILINSACISLLY